MSTIPEGHWLRSAAIFGATGGIGAALCRALADRGCAVTAFSRSGEAPRHSAIKAHRFDLENEHSVAEAIEASGMAESPPDLTIVATGVLTLAGGTGPERTLKAIDADAMTKVMQINAVGPAIIARHMLPLMKRDQRFAFGAISAKVGSIGDNAIGGWHSYRASKAALNMLIKNFAIETARTHPSGVVVALHPGTVDTALSRPFQNSLPEGQLTTRREAALNLLDVVEALGPSDSGGLFGWNGQQITP